MEVQNVMMTFAQGGKVPQFSNHVLFIRQQKVQCLLLVLGDDASNLQHAVSGSSR
jgi:translation elongation factor EF-Tu-like GTPase